MRPWSRCLHARAGIRDQLGLRRAEAQGAMRPGPIVVVEVLAQDLDQVPGLLGRLLTGGTGADAAMPAVTLTLGFPLLVVAEGSPAGLAGSAWRPFLPQLGHELNEDRGREGVTFTTRVVSCRRLT